MNKLTITNITGTKFFTIQEDGTDYKADFLLVERHMVERLCGERVDYRYSSRDGVEDKTFHITLKNDNGEEKMYGISLNLIRNERKLNHTIR